MTKLQVRSLSGAMTCSFGVVPQVGVEPTTFRLGGGCSTRWRALQDDSFAARPANHLRSSSSVTRPSWSKARPVPPLWCPCDVIKNTAPPQRSAMTIIDGP